MWSFGEDRIPCPASCASRQPTPSTIFGPRLIRAVSGCAVQAGYSGRDTYFPHGQDEAGFERSLRNNCNGVPEPVRKAIAALEPYYGGKSYLLRALHDLNIIDKHSELLEVSPG